jgi:hypothetical protein
VKTGLRQGCLLSPALFNVFIDHVAKLALEKFRGKHGIRIQYRMPDGRRHEGTLDEGIEWILDLFYADDLVLLCENEETLREVVMSFEEQTQAFGLTISVTKTKQLITEARGHVAKEADIVLRNERVDKVRTFRYLGTDITEEGGCSEEIERRIGMGWCKYNELKKALWKQRGVSLETKLQIYRATVLSTVLYGAEAWTCTAAHYQKINSFHTKTLRLIVDKRWDQITNAKLYKLTNSSPLSGTNSKYRLRWAGHVRRMPSERIPKRVLFGELVDGKRARGRQPVEYWDCLEDDLARANVKSSGKRGHWCEASKNRTEWLKTISHLTQQ